MEIWISNTARWCGGRLWRKILLLSGLDTGGTKIPFIFPKEIERTPTVFAKSHCTSSLLDGEQTSTGCDISSL